MPCDVEESAGVKALCALKCEFGGGSGVAQLTGPLKV